MQGMSEREYAAHAGIPRGAVQKAKVAHRLVMHADGSIDGAASDVRRAATTDLAKSRLADRSRLAAVPDVPEPQASGGPPPRASSGDSFLKARTANEVWKAQERQIRLAQLKGELVDRDRAVALVFRLARQERDAWVTWPARVAALMAADLSAAVSGETRAEVTIGTGLMQKILEDHVRAHLAELAEPTLEL